MRLIFTVDLVAPVLHPAVPHVVADQLAGDAVRGVATLELVGIVTCRNILDNKIFQRPLSVRLKVYLYLCPCRLEALGPHCLVRQVEGELEDVGL